MAGVSQRTLNPKEKLVLAALRRRGKPASAYDLIGDLKPEGVKAPPTVYRALGRLIEDGLVHRLESLNAFVACTHDHAHDAVAFAVCDECGSVSEFDVPQVAKVFGKWASSEQFNLRHTTMELRGCCSACAMGGQS
ncbi:MAG: transcriptional repressor [Alphaproteobacteria bacterium]|nr:transcriptional repressor [Alphaproteobacteria bacterium]